MKLRQKGGYTCLVSTQSYLIVCLLIVLGAERSSAQTQFSWRNDQNPGNGNWNNANQWWNGSAAQYPLGGEILFLDGITQPNMTNDLNNFNRYRINFGNLSAPASRTIGGTSINVFDAVSSNIPMIANNSGVQHTINFPFQIGNTSTSTSPNYGFEIDAVSGNLVFGSAISAANNTGTKVLVLRASSSGTGNITLNGAISNGNGTMAISKVDNNTAILAGNNSYSGGTTLSAGTLCINNSTALGATAGTFTIGANTTINNTTAGEIVNINNNPMAWNGDFTFTGSNSLNLGTGTVSMNASRQVTVSGSTLTVGGIISGTNFSLTKLGTGTLVLGGANTYTGGTTLSAGTLAINNATALGAAAGTFNIADGTFIVNTSGADITIGNVKPMAWNGNFTFNGTNNLNLGTGAVTMNANRTITVNNNTLTVGGAISNCTFTLIKTGIGTLVLGGANAHSGGTTLSAGTLTLSNNAAAGSGLLTLQAGTTLDAGVSNLNLGNTHAWNGDFTFTGTNSLNLGTGAVTMSASRQVTVSASTLTVGGVISGSGFSLTKTGSGTLVLGGANTYSGGTTLSAGTLSISSIAIGGSNSPIGASSSAAGNLVLGGGTLEYSAGNTANTDRAFTLTNLITSTINVSNASGVLTISGQSAISSGGLIKAGPGTLVLSGANQYSGGTTLSSGTLSLNNNNAPGTGLLTISGGNLNAGVANITLGNSHAWNGDFTFTGTNSLNLGNGTVTMSANRQVTVTANTLTVGGVISGSGFSLTKLGANGILVLAGNNTFSGGTILSSGTLTLNHNNAAGTGLLTISGGSLNAGVANITLGNTHAWNGDFTFTGTNSLNLGTGAVTMSANRQVTVSANTLTVGGIVSGANITLTKAGNGTLVLSGANTYTGLTTVSAGTLQLANASNTTLPSTNNVTIAGGNLQVSVNQTLNDVTLNSGTLTVDNGDVLTINGTLTINGGSLTVTGSIAYGSNGKLVYGAGRTTGAEWNSGNVPSSVDLNSGTVVVNTAVSTSGNLTISGSAVLQGGINTISVGGNWSNYGTGGFTEGTSTVTFTGSGSQTINNTVGTEDFFSITKTGAGTLTANCNVALAGTSSAFSLSNGIFDAGIFSLSGTASTALNLSGGTLRLGSLSGTLPNFSTTTEGAGGFNITGGTVELSGLGAQTLRGSRTYNNLLFSGTGTKTITSSIANLVAVTITNTNTLDVQGFTFGGGTTTFTMSNGRFRSSKLSNAQPEMDGVYTISGGTVELYGTGNNQEQTLRGGKTYFNVELNSNAANTTNTSSNVVQGSGTVTIASGGAFTVRSPTVFEMGGNAIISGAGNFTVEAGATLMYGDTYGIKTSGTSSTDGNIRVNGTRTFSTSASYGFAGSVDGQFTGNALPGTVNNLHFRKTTAASKVYLDQSVQISGELNLYNGEFQTGNNTLGVNGTISKTNGTILTNANSSLSFGANATSLTLPNGLFTSNPAITSFTIDRSGGIILGNQPITVSGTLAMTNGIITNTTANQITLGTAGTITGGSSTSYFTGPLAVQFAGSGRTIRYPVGKLAYRPLTFTSTNAASGTLTGEYFALLPPGLGQDTYANSLTGLLNTEHWQLERSSGTTEGTITLPYVNPGGNNWRLLNAVDGSAPCTYCNVAIVKRSSNTGAGTWDFPGFQSGGFVDPGSGTPEARPYTVSGDIISKNVNSFSYFGFGYAFNSILVLPITLGSFTAQPQANGNQLFWQMQQQSSLLKTVVMFSRDGVAFQTIGELPRNDSSNAYRFDHNGTGVGTHFYRLTLLGNNGQVQYSPVLKVQSGNNSTTIGGLAPNPVRSNRTSLQLWSARPQMLQVSITDVTGRVLQHAVLPVSAGAQWLPIALPLGLLPGLYRVQVTLADGVTRNMALVKE